MCALVWALWNRRNDMIFSKTETCYLYGYPRDSRVILSSFEDVASVYGFWMQLAGDSYSGYIGPGWLVSMTC
jgi:hypothetical protein